MDGATNETNELSDEQLETVAGGLLRLRAPSSYLPAVQAPQGELDMIQLQTMLSQYSQLQTLTTNTMQKQQDASNSILHNLRG